MSEQGVLLSSSSHETGFTYLAHSEPILPTTTILSPRWSEAGSQASDPHRHPPHATGGPPLDTQQTQRPLPATPPSPPLTRRSAPAKVR
jgi:hypothetical protein